jgi:hypothetical protein
MNYDVICAGSCYLIYAMGLLLVREKYILECDWMVIELARAVDAANNENVRVSLVK